jgi:hypothetical protein
MRIDFHVHSERSPDGIHSINEMVKYAKKVGLDGIAITDHNKLIHKHEAKELTKDYGILVIPGIEGGPWASGKHWIALNIEDVPQGKEINEILKYVEDEGGTSIAPHPYSTRGFKNYEELGFDTVEVLNGFVFEPFWKRRINHTKIPPIGGSDAHAKYMLGYTWTEVDSGETIEDVLESVRKGHCNPEGSKIPRSMLLRYYTQFFLKYTTFYGKRQRQKQKQKKYESAAYPHY